MVHSTGARHEPGGLRPALVVGLLITTAKTAYDTQGGEFRRMSAEIVLLDRPLAHYGSEANGARDQLRRTVADMLHHMDSHPGLQAAPPNPTERSESVYDVIQALAPQNDTHARCGPS